jgi:hypothetical protein
MDLKINIAYFPFQVNGIKVSLPSKDGSSNIEISRSGSYVTAFSSECNIRVHVKYSAGKHPLPLL